LIAALDERGELVDREIVLHAVAELLGDVSAVVREGLRSVLGYPAAVLVLKRLRKIPVIERGEWLDALGAKLVGEALVEVDALRIRRARALREDARPGDGEPVGGRVDVLHQRDVLLVAVVVVVGDVAIVVVLDVAGRVREFVPDRLALAVLVPSALDLIRG